MTLRIYRCLKYDPPNLEGRSTEGWDYPPRMGAFGIVSPRTCGDCTIEGTLWMALQSGKITSIDDMTPEQRATLARIQNEPTSIMPPK